MFKNINMPKHLGTPLIKEAILEIRYESELPEQIQNGKLYEIFSKYGTIQELPFLQVPYDIRKNDPNLKYQSLYRILDENFIATFGSHSITFSVQSPYSGWETWNNFFMPILTDVNNSKIICKVDNISIRYIDIIEENILEKTNTIFKIYNQDIKNSNNTTYFRTEFNKENLFFILQFTIKKSLNNHKLYESIIDVDCHKKIKITVDDFFNSLTDITEELHVNNKKAFFSLLNEDFLSELKPEY